MLFIAKAQAQTCSGTVDITGNSGTINDGSGPIRSYGTDLDCTWDIIPQGGGPIRLTFTEFETSDDGDRLGLSTFPTSLSFFQTLFGDLSDLVPFVINVPSNRVVLRFRTDDRNRSGSEGWTLNYETDFVNEAPVIAPQAFSTPEQTIPGTIIGFVEAEDETAGILLDYQIVSGNEAGFFELNERTGELKVIGDETKQLDFETESTYTLRVEVSDGLASDAATITINVTDVDEALLPQIADPVQAFEYGVRLPVGTELASLNVTNPGANPLIFQEIVPDRFFQLDGQGRISIEDLVFLPDTYEYLVAVSNEVGSSIARVTFRKVALGCEGIVTLSNTSGEFSDGSGPSLFGESDCSWNIRPEGGGPIRISFTELDLDNGRGGEGNIAIYGGADASAPLIARFGRFTRGLPVLATDADEVFVFFEGSFLNDEGQGWAATYESGFQNQAPVRPSGPLVYNIPKEAGNGTIIGRISIIDPDNDALTFTIEEGDTNGDLRLGQLSRGDSIVFVEFNSRPEERADVSRYDLTISVSDGIDAISFPVTINLLEGITAAPTIEDQTFTIEEGFSRFESIGEIIASDPNNLPLLFSIVSQSVPNAFSLPREFDFPRNRIFPASSVLDFETNPVITFEVEVANGFATSQATITVQLEDVGCTGAVTVTENEGTISDGNGEADYENNSSCEWILAPEAGGPIEVSFTAFDVEQDFDVLTFTAAAGESNELIRSFTGSELPDTFLIDADQALINFTTGAVGTADGWSFTYRSLNTAPTAPDQEFSILESSVSATIIGTVLAIDTQNDIISYAIISGNTDNTFAINTETGELTVNNSEAIDPEVNPSFFLTVEASDGFLSSTTTITVAVEEVLSVGSVPGSFNVYPNPVSDRLTVTLRRDHIRTIIITDLYGKQVISHNNKEFIKKDAEINLAVDLPNGVYILRVEGPDFVESLKILVKKESN